MNSILIYDLNFVVFNSFFYDFCMCMVGRLRSHDNIGFLFCSISVTPPATCHTICKVTANSYLITFGTE